MTPERKGSKGLLLPIAHEMQVLRRQGPCSMIRRLLVLVVVLAVLALLVTFYSTIEASYLDLVDSLILESIAPHISDTVDDGISSSSPVPALACNDDSSWVDEWISSGVMPKCSLAHQSKIDVLYTYILFRRKLIVDG
jgi:hypothetical protein